MKHNWTTTNPKESGYYFSHYYNIRPDGYFYKCIYWCEKRQNWISWRNPLGSTLHHFQVVKFVKETKGAFYSECMEKIL
jgi:hypothetical protein